MKTAILKIDITDENQAYPLGTGDMSLQKMLQDNQVAYIESQEPGRATRGAVAFFQLPSQQHILDKAQAYLRSRQNLAQFAIYIANAEKP